MTLAAEGVTQEVTSVIGFLAAKNVRIHDGTVDAEFTRLDSAERKTVARYLARSDVDLANLQAEAPIAVQRFIARLDRHGAAGIGLPSCLSCHQRRVLKYRDANKRRICHRCHERRRYGECHTCQRMKKLTADDGRGHLVCQRCSAQGITLVACTACGKEVAATTEHGGAQVCLNCYPRKLRTCSACGKEKKIASHIRGGPHCFACRTRVLRNPKPCPGCGRIRILAFLDEQHTPACAECAGQPARYACRRCGGEEHQFGRLCGKCTLSDRLDIVLVDPNGQITEPMRLLRDYLMQQPRPVQIIKWLRIGPHTDLLRDIATGAKPLSEETFAAATGGKGLLYLRALLADSGAFPIGHTELARLRTWCDAQLESLPAAQRIVVRQYLNWRLLRRAKRDNATGDVIPGAVKHVRAAIRAIKAFINWLGTEEQTDLRHLTQDQVDRYTQTTDAGRWLPQFLRWASKSGHIESEVDFPFVSSGQPALTLTEQQIGAIIDAVVEDMSADPGVRLALLLIAIYGLSASRVVELYRAQLVATSADDARIAIGEHQQTLPPAVARIAFVHLRNIEESQSPWLFPGLRPGQHITTQRVRRALDSHGVTLAQLQVAARYRLAGAVHAKILADSLNFSVSTMARYASLSNGRWGDYPDLRQ